MRINCRDFAYSRGLDAVRWISIHYDYEFSLLAWSTSMTCFTTSILFIAFIVYKKHDKIKIMHINSAQCILNCSVIIIVTLGVKCN